MSNLTDFADGIEQDVVAYAYEVARFSVFEDSDAPDRKVTDWSWHVSYDEPSKDDWKQEDVMEHRLRNVTGLVHGEPDTDDAIAYQYEYVGHDGDTRDKLGTDDSRWSDAVVRCRPLVPKESE